jgi:hypothetical protein
MKTSKLDSCVFYFFNEHEKQKKRIITYKITNYDFFTNNELTNIAKIISIPTYKSMYYVCEKNDSLKIAEYKDKSYYLTSGKEIGSDNTVLLKYEDKQLISLKKYLKALSSPRKYIFTIIEFYRHFLHSIRLLHMKQIVHNHVCIDSFYVDNHSPLISDFSFSLDLSCFNNSSYIRRFFGVYDPSYIERPFELHLLSYLLTNKLDSLSKQNIETVIKHILQNHGLLHTFGETIVNDFILSAMQFSTKYINQNYEYIIADILTYSNTWDNYALSIVFLRILIYLHKCMKKQNKFIILFMKLLVSNIDLSPLKRLSFDETTNKFETIIDSLEPSELQEIIQNLVLA